MSLKKMSSSRLPLGNTPLSLKGNEMVAQMEKITVRISTYVSPMS